MTDTVTAPAPQRMPTDRWLAAVPELPPLDGPAGTGERLLLLLHYGVDWDAGWVSSTHSHGSANSHKRRPDSGGGSAMSRGHVCAAGSAKEFRACLCCSFREKVAAQSLTGH